MNWNLAGRFSYRRVSSYTVILNVLEYIIYILQFPTFFKNLCMPYFSQLGRHKFLGIIYFKMVSWLAIPISYPTSSAFSLLHIIVRSSSSILMISRDWYNWPKFSWFKSENSMLFVWICLDASSCHQSLFLRLLDFGVLEKDSAWIE